MDSRWLQYSDEQPTLLRCRHHAMLFLAFVCTALAARVIYLHGGYRYRPLRPPAVRYIQDAHKTDREKVTPPDGTIGIPGNATLGTPKDSKTQAITSKVTTSLNAIKCHLLGSFATTGIRLGNHMFIYAAVVGIAEMNRMIPVFHSQLLSNAFGLGLGSKSSFISDEDQLPSVAENASLAYDRRFEQLHNISCSSFGDVMVVGYFQSWKYFRKVRSRILRDFQFRPTHQNAAESFLRSIAMRYRLINGEDVVYIGVHIRREDMLEPENQNEGYTVADEDYLTKAVVYMNQNFTGTTGLVYVVCSDDLRWSRQHFTNAVRRTVNSQNGFGLFSWLRRVLKTETGLFRFSNRNEFQAYALNTALTVVFSTNHSAEVDLAILSLCNHTIMTVGTYGWWAGYLAGGVTVYYQNFPRNGSKLQQLFNHEDYFPPEWVGL